MFISIFLIEMNNNNQYICTVFIVLHCVTLLAYPGTLTYDKIIKIPLLFI